MPSIYGDTNIATQAAASDTEILKYIKTATEILTDLKRAGPPGKQTALDRLAVLNQMIKLKLESRLKM
jgi:hypothetical protein